MTCAQGGKACPLNFSGCPRLSTIQTQASCTRGPSMLRTPTITRPLASPGLWESEMCRWAKNVQSDRRRAMAQKAMPGFRVPDVPSRILRLGPPIVPFQSFTDLGPGFPKNRKQVGSLTSNLSGGPTHVTAMPKLSDSRQGSMEVIGRGSFTMIPGEMVKDGLHWGLGREGKGREPKKALSKAFLRAK